MWHANARAEDRRLAQVDTTDLVTGIILVILVPILSLVVAGMLGVKGSSDKFLFREGPEVDPVPDREEIDARYRYAEDLYLQNAKRFLESAEALKAQPDGEYFRRWTNDSLKQADSAFVDVESMIKRYPEASSQFQTYLGRVVQYRAEIQRDMERARSLDVLKLDVPR
jgi:hypothetical protein